jgi:phage-related protein
LDFDGIGAGADKCLDAQVLFDPLEEQFDLPAKVIVVNQGVLEVVEDDVGGTYRAVYTVKFAEAVFVLHCFQKKSKRGIATPKEDMDIIHARLKIAEAYVKELRK